MQFFGWVSLAITGSALLSLALTRIGPHLIMMGVLVLLSATGILTPAEALGGFSNAGLITVAAMFVVASGIENSGGVDLLVSRVLGEPKSIRAALFSLCIPVMSLSAFLNNTPVVATMIPAVHVWSRKIGVPASKLMIPLSYAAILGGTITLIGTSTNLVVNGQYQKLTGETGFSPFSIAPIGIPVALVETFFMWAFFPRLLPSRDEHQAFANLREFTLEVMVDAAGPLVGRSISAAGLRNLKRIYLAEIARGDTVLSAVASEERLLGGDRLIFAGDTQAIADLLRIPGLLPSSDGANQAPNLADRSDRRLIEAVVSPHCSAVGLPIRVARFRDRYGAVVLAVARNGERVVGNLGTIELQAGDTLLLEARQAFVSRQRHNKDFLLINDTQTSRPAHEKALLAWSILIVLVVAAAFDALSMLNASLIGAALMVITGCCNTAQAERSLDLTVILTIGASFALGEALEKTGVASYLAQLILSFSGGLPWLTLVLVYATVSLLTEVITNNAAAILVLPIVLSLAKAGGMQAEPFVLAVMMGASASFATPLGYQTNLMVYGPGGYRASDFLRVGVVMNLLIGAVTILVLLLGWDLT